MELYQISEEFMKHSVWIITTWRNKSPSTFIAHCSHSSSASLSNKHRESLRIQNLLSHLPIPRILHHRHPFHALHLNTDAVKFLGDNLVTLQTTLPRLLAAGWNMLHAAGKGDGHSRSSQLNPHTHVSPSFCLNLPKFDSWLSATRKPRVPVAERDRCKDSPRVEPRRRYFVAKAN